MCDRLSCKSWIKISQDHVSDQRTYQNCNKSKKQLPLSKQYHVTDSSNHTQAGSLCKCTYQKPCDQGDCNCSMLCSRTTVSFCEVDECRCCNKKQKNSDFHYWENAAFNRLHFIGTFQSIAFFQEKCSCQNTTYKTGQTEDGISVTACQTQRSQFQNRDYAMQMLKSKLMELKIQQHAEKISDLKGVQLKIEWGSQIRSYVFMPYQLVKDTRTDYETGNIQAVMDGDLDGFINAYLTKAANGELKK